ncbi:MAG: adenylate kinase [Microgenomates group bacterium Gr01-1014_16]|nr:MAG: adenylate kinase [Microgenomates group bacterium Gr01-1014_16]
MNIILLGPQGSGKGTQADLLVQKYGLNYVEMGKILRSIAESDNQHAKTVKEYLNKGDLVPDEFVRLIAWDHINKQDKEKGFLFDGYPRGLAQYDHLKDMLMKFGKKIDWVVYLYISPEESIRRLSARRTCEKCGEIFNLVTNPPKNPEVCDKCGGKLTQREDDQPEAIKRRLELFGERTKQILEKAKQEGVLLEIDGERAIDKIHEDIVDKLWIK